MNEFNGLFIKIGQYDHLKSLQFEGQIYCATLQYFANLIDEQGKGDNLENVNEITYYEKATMHLIFDYNNYDEVVSFDISGSHKYNRVTSHCGNLFCLYTINFNDLPYNQVQKFNIDNKLGTHALIIRSELFFKKLDDALRKIGYNYCADFIEYIDFSKYSGKKTFFQKDISFAQQKEYRILINSPENTTLKLMIGNIEDISTLIPIEELLAKVILRADKNLQDNIICH